MVVKKKTDGIFLFLKRKCAPPAAKKKKTGLSRGFDCIPPLSTAAHDRWALQPMFKRPVGAVIHADLKITLW